MAQPVQPRNTSTEIDPASCGASSRTTISRTSPRATLWEHGELRARRLATIRHFGAGNQFEVVDDLAGESGRGRLLDDVYLRGGKRDATQVGLLEVCSPKVGPIDPRVAEQRAPESNLAERGPRQVGPHQPRS